MPGLITCNYQEEEQSKDRDSTVLRRVGWDLTVSRATSNSNPPFLKTGCYTVPCVPAVGEVTVTDIMW